MFARERFRAATAIFMDASSLAKNDEGTMKNRIAPADRISGAVAASGEDPAAEHSAAEAGC